MEFGWINIFGMMIVLLLLIPNLIYAWKGPNEKNQCKSFIFNAVEQIGRYASMALMVMPVGVWRFGFSSKKMFLLYVSVNLLLLCLYWLIWRLYFRKRTLCTAIVLAVIPTCIFLISGLTLRHWVLVFAAFLFGTGHLYVTIQNHL